MLPRRTTTTILATLAVMLGATPAAEAARSVSTTPAQRARAASIAVSKVRSPYSWGATGPRAFDCSGLVTFAYQRAGSHLRARTSYDLFRRGARLRRAGLRRGDLVWTWDRGLGHVGIYVGRNRYVHAPGAGRRVQVAPLPTGRAFVAAVRP